MECWGGEQRVDCASTSTRNYNECASPLTNGDRERAHAHRGTERLRFKTTNIVLCHKIDGWTILNLF